MGWAGGGRRKVPYQFRINSVLVPYFNIMKCLVLLIKVLRISGGGY